VNNHTHCVAETFDAGLVTDAGLGVRLLSAEGIDAAPLHAMNASYASSKLATGPYGRPAAAEMAKCGITTNVVGPAPKHKPVTV